MFVCLFGRGLGQALLGRVFWVFLYVCLLLFFDSQDWEYVLSYNKYIKSIMVRALIVLGFLLICSSFNYVHDLQANLEETILS